MKWFRFYNEVLDDPKVQQLTPELFKFWVNILCIASKNDGKLPSIEAISYHVRASVSATQCLIDALLEARLLQEFSNQHSEWLAPHAWQKRQYKSDTSSERVKRFRNTKRNNIVTPPDTDTDTEQIKNKKTKAKKTKVSLDELSVNHIQEWLAKKRVEGKYIHHNEHDILETFKNYCISKGKKYENFIAAYRNAFEWDRCQPKSGINSNERKLSKHERARIALGLDQGESKPQEAINVTPAYML